ncbi:MAG: hypothetical protein QW505_00680 [Thermoplasmata archaeon]
MVAKAATRSGEYFCFHCGKGVQKDDARCASCGVEFDRIVESFRCPRCSNLLPVGAVACPSCNLGFKVKTVESPDKMTPDDKFLMKLIEWGKQDDGSSRPSPPGGRTVRVAKPPPPPPPPPPSEGVKRVRPVAPAKPTPSAAPPIATDIRTKKESQVPSSLKSQATGKQIAAGIAVKMPDIPARTVERPEPKAKVVDTSTREIATPRPDRRPDVQQLIAQLEEESKERDRLENEIRELKAMMQREKTEVPERPEPEKGLSSQVLKKLLEERDREIKDLKAREEELARREEHLNRKIRAYSIKMKELEAAQKGVGAPGQKAESQTSGQDVEGRYETEILDEREEWIKDQSKIKAGLIEIRNQMISGRDAGQVNYYPSPPSGELLEKIEVLEERLADANREREELQEQLRKLEESRKDVSTLLKVLDQLLGKLPPEIIDEFSKSENFRLYEKVLDDLNI